MRPNVIFRPAPFMQDWQSLGIIAAGLYRAATVTPCQGDTMDTFVDMAGRSLQEVGQAGVIV